MRRLCTVLLSAALLLAGLSAFAADLTIDAQVNLAAKDYASNYLTFQGAINSVEKDQFAPGADATSGASKLASTEVFNAYRFDVKGKKTLPGAIRNFLLYGIANDSIRTGDGLTVRRAADGTFTIRSVHRGMAQEIVTDASGKIQLPGSLIRTRVIGATDNTISTDFSSTGKVANVDWAKVWDASIPDGRQVGTTSSKTGKIVVDVADSDLYTFQGSLQVSVVGPNLKIIGDLAAKVK